MAKKFTIVGGKFAYAKLSTSEGGIGFVLTRPNGAKVVAGGTAKDVQITAYTAVQESVYEAELITGGLVTELEAKTASVIDVTATSAGTVNLDVSNSARAGDSIKILHKNKNDEWEILFDGEVPAGCIVTVTLTEYSPVSVFKNLEISKYNITTTLNNVTADASNPAIIDEGGNATLLFTGNTGYDLPANVTVTGRVQSSWSQSTGTLTLSNTQGDVDITITGTLKVYNITPSLTNVTAAQGNPTTVLHGQGATLTFTADQGYNLPDSVSVTGATGVWTKATGTLVLSNATGPVSFAIAGIVWPKLSTPTNLEVVDNTSVRFDQVENATTYEAFVDGTSIGEAAGDPVPEAVKAKRSLFSKK